MFHVHGVQGREFSGTLEALRLRRTVGPVARVRGIAPTSARLEASALPPATHRGVGQEALAAYGGVTTARVRRPLTCAADVMRSPALTLSADATLGEAWRFLAEHGIGQAPVLDGYGVLVGLVARSELMPLEAGVQPDAAAERARLSRPVTAVMWSPVPSTAASTDLRRVAALLLDTGLPGVPVAEDNGLVLGFVSRTDLLRALATDPPLDLWG